MRRRREFWWGVATGALAVVLLIGLWALYAYLQVQRMVDDRAAQYVSEHGMSERVEMSLPAPDLPPEDGPADELGRARYDWTVTDLDGQNIPFEEFEDRTVFLVFWATWCPPCRAEMPSIRTLMGRVEDDERIAFVLVSDERLEVVRDYADEQFPDLPFYVVEGGLPSSLWPPARPTAFVLDCGGDIVLRHAGGADWSGAEVADFLRRRAAVC